MNETLKFQPDDIPSILDGSKTATWRLWDDKNVSVADTVDFINGNTLEKFATATIQRIKNVSFAKMTETDLVGHQRFASTDAMLHSFEKMHRRSVTEDTVVKIIWFTLIP